MTSSNHNHKIFNINDSKYHDFLKNDQIEDTYSLDCLPNKLLQPSTEKSKLAKFEALDLNIYKKAARMVAFRKTVNRIQPWIKTMILYYYEYLGKRVVL